ncbi:SH3 domain-containing protein [Aliishimia ponticola]|uniref:SH3 domain-containing protein n=1 Tax=Aliishimia ponticola TaxID=2499833 RepID=A0A4S4N792_9RHOB|nr:SH3 domain-containing protein [Aliishimia ponticola]THH35024.1 SH3 domain-containing protein [Aliishimia ponticola]
MVRFILLSFAFLGWAFYEMSGGAEFEPRSARMGADAPVALMAAHRGGDGQAVPLQESVEVTRVSLNLTSVDDVMSGKTRKAKPTPVEAIAAAAEAKDELPRIVIPSLVEKTRAASAATITAAAQSADIRNITGNRVNVRGGPGTDFGVVTKMVRGDEVEVLEDNGSGWIRMRSIDTGSVGWVADFLLSEG